MECRMGPLSHVLISTRDKIKLQFSAGPCLRVGTGIEMLEMRSKGTETRTLPHPVQLQLLIGHPGL